MFVHAFFMKEAIAIYKVKASECLALESWKAGKNLKGLGLTMYFWQFWCNFYVWKLIFSFKYLQTKKINKIGIDLLIQIPNGILNSDHCDLPAVWRAKKVKHDLIESWLKYIYFLEFSSWLCNRDNFLFITQAFSMVKYKDVVEIFAIVEFLSSKIATNNLGSQHEVFSKFPLVCSGWSHIEILIDKSLDLWNPCLRKTNLIILEFSYNKLAWYGPKRKHSLDYASRKKSKFYDVIELPTWFLKRNWHIHMFFEMLENSRIRQIVDLKLRCPICKLTFYLRNEWSKTQRT